MMTRGAARLLLLGLLAAAPGAAAPDPAVEPRLFVLEPGGAMASPVLQTPFEGVLDDPTLVWVVLPMGDSRVRFLVGASGLRDTNVLQPLLFESGDCSGLQLIGAPSEPDAILDPLVLGAMVYWPDGLGSRRTVRSEGWLVHAPEQCGATFYPPNVCCAPVQAPQAREVAPAATIELGYLRLVSAP